VASDVRPPDETVPVITAFDGNPTLGGARGRGCGGGGGGADLRACVCRLRRSRGAPGAGGASGPYTRDGSGRDSWASSRARR
jgi:hypothetical protein